ncbi:MAG: Ku protein, partial [Heliobacteriaceae bacterium]|nr:Ku protein [Heliobacteriaceae bacterium]
MKTIWKGAVSFGLVHIPVKLYAATEDADIRFHLLHKECLSPIRYLKNCPHCQREVAPAEIIKGFEVEKGRYITISPEELAALSPEKDQTITIRSFVHLTEIDPVYFVKTYYLAPDRQGNKAFGLLRTALAETGRLALARIVLRTRENLAALRVFGDGLALHTMLYPQEIRPLTAIGDISPGNPLSGQEKAMAVQLVESLTAPFKPEELQNTYQANLQELLAAKTAGEAPVPVAPPVAAGQVTDLLA